MVFLDVAMFAKIRHQLKQSAGALSQDDGASLMCQWLGLPRRVPKDR
jgi:hypothetical protein